MKKKNCPIYPIESCEYPTKSSLKNAVCDNVLEHLDLKQINDFFVAIKKKMSRNAKLVIIVPGKKGFKRDPTHKTYISKQIIEKMCSAHNVKLENNFWHPINLAFVGDFFYLNIQVFTLRF